MFPANRRYPHEKTACRSYGALRMDGNYVTESVRKYLSFTLDKHQSVKRDFITYHADGTRYPFEGATLCFARISVSQNKRGTVLGRKNRLSSNLQ